ncbi:cobalt ABC transporter permease [Candidatus Atribacteria bacterium RBG_19FT_COMBO_35_14]|uniref:Cobalt ABC transporter permease n=1 Tax=Candidatus Sediminicultor quintus TaxID=1797291 RepID=A0A1F5AET8_9BACT|nr:MAG: cobalt ABC transporter permease [Candidatus Atribacteria bacterium RBG_19FT_COMBO_35_14]OGD33306.1 MAG: cobalt ABC transporter permease [Candidatus Atribacteria bacterium RBG_16_35_8]
MHISEGILSAPVLITGVSLTATAVGYGLKKMDYKQMPKVAILSSVFFVASLIHVPLGPSSVHLILNGVTGVLLGWSAFPAILVALALQGVLFQFGGITTLGVNTFNMALPAIICFYLFNRGVRSENNFIVLILAFVCGFLAVLLSGVMVAAALVFTGEPFIQAAKLVIIAHLPVMILEGVLTAFCIGFLRKVRPEILNV